MSTFPENPAQEPYRTERTDEVKASALAGGSTLLALCGAAAIVLTIIGLAHAWPSWMVTISVLVIGGGFMAHGMGIMARNARLVSQTGGTLENTEAALGMSPEFLAGCVGVVLGILSIIGIYPTLLSAIAVIAFGGALVFGSSTVNVADMRVGAVSTSPVSTVERRGNFFSRPLTAHLMMGLGIMALGILAVIGIRPLILTLVGLLSLGFVLLLAGSAIGARMATRLMSERREARA